MRRKKKPLVLDANILLGCVLGKKTFSLLLDMSEVVQFFTPDICLEEVHRHLPAICEKRGIDPIPLFDMLGRVLQHINILEETVYSAYQEQALLRIPRDKNDWMLVACGLMLKSPIWTQDRDFFGCGLPIWSTGIIHLYASCDY